jgi:hypothetical protein
MQISLEIITKKYNFFTLNLIRNILVNFKIWESLFNNIFRKQQFVKKIDRKTTEKHNFLSKKYIKRVKDFKLMFYLNDNR